MSCAHFLSCRLSEGTPLRVRFPRQGERQTWPLWSGRGVPYICCHLMESLWLSVVYPVISEQNLIQYNILQGGFVIGKETGAQTAADGCGCLWQFPPLQATNCSVPDCQLRWSGSVSLCGSALNVASLGVGEVVASCIRAVTLLPPTICSLPPVLSAFQHLANFPHYIFLWIR